MISTKTKNRWDYYNVIDGAKIQGQEIGEALGRAEGRTAGARETTIKVAANLKEMGLSTEEVAKATGLSIEEIKEL
jgi:predicted transposase/invertase (TIGR01784 family)